MLLTKKHPAPHKKHLVWDDWPDAGGRCICQEQPFTLAHTSLALINPALWTLDRLCKQGEEYPRFWTYTHQSVQPDSS